jgi:hypothetical protein
MKKRLMSLGAVLVVMSFLVGCATIYPVGTIFTEVKLPAEATSADAGTKVGTSQCISVLGLIAVGDASIEAAMKNGGIKKIHHVDWDAKNILGVYGQYKTTVYGK